MFGFYDGISGLVTEPVKGHRKEGVVGALKGFGKGVGGLYLKPSAAMFGLLGYTAQGIYMSMHGAIHTKTRQAIAAARRAEGAWMLARARETGDVILEAILDVFLELQAGKAAAF